MVDENMSKLASDDIYSSENTGQEVLKASMEESDEEIEERTMCLVKDLNDHILTSMQRTREEIEQIGCDTNTGDLSSEKQFELVEKKLI